MLTQTLTIEKGVPLPPRRSPSAIAETLREMETGDSFVLNSTNPKADMTTVRKVAKTLGVKLTARTHDGKMRVWRVE